MNKLIRDKIPEIALENGDVITISQCTSPNILIQYLHEKLIEEATELQQAITGDETIEELADIMEVFDAILDAHQLSWDNIYEVQYKKTEDKGGFTKGYILHGI